MKVNEITKLIYNNSNDNHIIAAVMCSHIYIILYNILTRLTCKYQHVDFNLVLI